MDNFNDVDATNADVRDDVQERYGAGANAVEAALCCPIDYDCLLYTSPSPRDGLLSRMPSSA